MSLLERMKKNSKIKETSTILDSVFFQEKAQSPTDIPMLNVALGGTKDSGVSAGLHVIAGKSRSFKTMFALVMAKAYLDNNPNGVILFYDNEFGSPKEYFATFGIPTDRVLHTPFMNIEELKFDIMAQLEQLTEKDDVFILIDSLGNAASKKEVDDAMEEKSVADMTRAKSVKSLTRMMTPFLAKKGIPCIAIQHTYQEIGMFSKEIVSGGTGAVYAANQIWLISRSQEKSTATKEIEGYHFKIKIEKSRSVKEGSIIPISVMYNSGIGKYSGLLDVALEFGLVVKTKVGWFAVVDPETGEVGDKNHRAKEFLKKEMWVDNGLLDRLAPYLEQKYKLVALKVPTTDDEVAEAFK